MSCNCLKYGLMLLLFCIVTCKDLKNLMENMRPQNSPVEVTAVFINCETDDIPKYPDNDDTRFEREELFKHNALRNCDKKLALTIKLTSASAKSSDEYVPIEHVLDGSSKRRVRLLNPYVLRLRRDAPLEAYKLRFIETVSGLLVTSNEQNHKYNIELPKETVDTEDSNSMEDWRTDLVSVVEPVRAKYALRVAGAALSAVPMPGAPRVSEHREKRQFNRIAEKSATITRFPANSRFSPGTSRRPPLGLSIQPQNTNCSTRNPPKTSSARNKKISVVFPTKRTKRHEKNVVIEEDDTLHTHLGGSSELSQESRFHKATDGNGDTSHNELITEVNNKMDSTILNDFKTKGNCRPRLRPRSEEKDSIDGLGKDFALYEVETPNLWFHVHVRLFEKLSTSKGNTLWNDITKGVSVSLSSLSPEWKGQDMNLHYKQVDATREDFFLPKSSLCLLIPLLEESMDTISSIDNSNYVLVPSEDVLDINKIDNSKRTSSNFSAEDRNEGRRKVVVRVTRALSNVMGGKFNVVNQASEKFLTMRHLGISRAQVDLEARADDNQLVHLSAPGRIAMIVADNTRGTRCMLTVQATNTGLFASQYRIEIRECDSDLLKLAEKLDGGASSEAEELPPRHTRRLRLRLPVPPAERQHCSGDNPRMPCQEMSAARQDAAGLLLPQRRGARLARACVYSDVTSVNIVVVVIGVIGMLLSFGVLKGLLGLVWARAGVWGLDWILERPRFLAHYYERALRARAVAYDDSCWPVHPDTGARTVRVVSLPVEFILNVVFFVAAPGLIAVDTLKQLTSKRKTAAVSDNRSKATKSSKGKISSLHDLQMFPLTDEYLHRLDAGQTSGSDSDLEDTAFVLMHMQKSSESLAKNQINPNAAVFSTDTELMTHSQTACKADLDKP